MKPQELICERRSPYAGENEIDRGAGGRGASAAPVLQLHAGEALHRLPVPGPIKATGPLDLAQVLDFPLPSEAQLRALFGLTPAEARLAQLLASGDTLEEVAEKLAIKLSTARSQLSVIFSKSDIRRQTKLVAILSRIAHLE